MRRKLGKTTLASSLRKCYKTTISISSSPIKHFLSCSTSSNTLKQRTRGIEVSMITNRKVKVSLWDLAGQDQYHAFHDNMFPNLSDVATPSIFLFVWNPILLDEVHGNEIKDYDGQIEIKTVGMFRQEFNYWLKFIASKTLTSSKFRPRVLVVITRADRLLRRRVRLPSGVKIWLKDTFDELQKEFEEYVQLDWEGYFEMDARNHSWVKTLADEIFRCAEEVLNSAPQVYQACDDARKCINECVYKKHSISPVLTKEEFLMILEERLHLPSKEIQEAVALSLNDSGDLIYFKSSSLVVLDTQWFCHHIMGDLLYFHGSEFQASKNGFFSEEVLGWLLESHVDSSLHAKCSNLIRCASNTSSTKVQGKTLVELLIDLQLACQQENSSHIFIPVTLGAKRQIYFSQLFKGSSNSTTYMGRNLKCKDSKRTFFTPGIFPMLQVTSCKIFSIPKVSLDKDIIEFSSEGVNVFARFCKPKDKDAFIEILINSSLDSNDTIEWVSKEVVNKFKSVCAHPKGIQGVELTCEILNPHYFEYIDHIMEDDDKESVSVEVLKGILEVYLNKKGFDPHNLHKIYYTWPAKKNSSSVVEVLGMADTLKVVELFQRKFIADVEDALGANIKNVISLSKQHEERVFSSSESGKERERIYNKLDEVHKDVQFIQQELQSIRKDISILCKATVPKLQETMDEMLKFGKEVEIAKYPRFFVVTKNDGVLRKIVANMVPGLQNVRLELLCEHQTKPHLVNGQNGLSFATLEDGLLKHGLPYIINFLKVAQVAVKVGVHLAIGPGANIPDFASILESMEATPQAPNFPTPFNSSSSSRPSLQDGQIWLSKVLSMHNCCTSIPIHENFGLSRVCCHNSSQVRWLCDEHRGVGDLCPI